MSIISCQRRNILSRGHEDWDWHKLTLSLATCINKIWRKILKAFLFEFFNTFSLQEGVINKISAKKCVQACYLIKMALELVLKSLLSSTKFVNSSPDEKDWIAISKLIPGATPKQVTCKG